MNSNYLINFNEGQKIKAVEMNANFQFVLDEITKQAEIVDQYIKAEFEKIKSQVNYFKPGDIKLTAYDDVPEGWLVCDGASYLIDDYKDLYDKIGTIFGQDDVLHFNVPDFKDKVPEGFASDSEPFGSVQKGKLPNIKASIGLGASGAYFNDCSGAFFRIDGSATRNQYQSDAGARVAHFSASAYSNLYDDNAKRPTVDRIKVNFLIKF
ncbi:MAG: phage tail protein [Candidatus Gastranaerophilaceae bacterium]